MRSPVAAGGRNREPELEEKPKWGAPADPLVEAIACAAEAGVAAEP